MREPFSPFVRRALAWDERDPTLRTCAWLALAIDRQVER